ncbi:MULTISPECIES: Mor transcription activator family protein [Photorhabdus]|uniref:Mor transcription activator family protein n=1 Tax=Photorhabdus TaxID=29487 RepID=UPI0007B4B0A4|nr:MULTISPECIES: Mor transcription activator family protein [Photorhabdus]AXG42218.1 transcriptional regulator [Photorhabdus laumondii subsp. laumondii]AXG42429.1 transcriptional regulator [Photorhabdus laumondii subsp. laumondii]MCC8387682.1 transcriptional regulator [Photorhabdus laumondii]MCZ1247940.1 transcriptional regulator [Photorhabdus laumondii subsp. laumondii]NDL15047.1 transcriptional regulator [Photorhabdus laumondii subsp. laumondii]
MNLELFDHDHKELGELLDQMDAIPSDELQTRWPQLLADIVDLFSCELQRQNTSRDKAELAACKLAGALAHYYGGRAVYLPTGDTLKIALRDNQLFNEWSCSRGEVVQLAKKYHLTHSTVYAILRQQLALHRKRYQGELFK